MVLIRRVEGLSMVPSFTRGKIVFAWRYKRPQVGDVVIARHHNLEIIKRVDKMQEQQVYLLGDNAEQSTDSREFGWLPLEAIIGVVMNSRQQVKEYV